MVYLSHLSLGGKVSVLYVDSLLVSPYVMFGAVVVAGIFIAILFLTKEKHGQLSLAVALISSSAVSLVVAGLSMFAVMNEDSKVLSTVEAVFEVTVIDDDHGDFKDGGRNIDFMFNGGDNIFRGHVELRGDGPHAAEYKSLHEILFTVVDSDGEMVPVEEFANEHNANIKGN